MAIRKRKEDTSSAVDAKKYADPVNRKYPIDTPERVRAAIVYFIRYGLKYYTKSEAQLVARRIIRAAKDFGIELSADNKLWKIAGLTPEK